MKGLMSASRNCYAGFIAAWHVGRNAGRYVPEGLRDQPVVLSYSATVDDLARQ
jgi:hypothetical protein